MCIDDQGKKNLLTLSEPDLTITVGKVVHMVAANIIDITVYFSRTRVRNTTSKIILVRFPGRCYRQKSSFKFPISG